MPSSRVFIIAKAGGQAPSLLKLPYQKPCVCMFGYLSVCECSTYKLLRYFLGTEKAFM